MKRNWFAFTASLLIAILCLSFAPEQRTLPSVEVKGLNGRKVDVATLSNGDKPMILIVWEITCQPCITELNAIAPLYKDWQTETGVKIIAISVDDSRSSPRVLPLVKSKGWNYEVYLDPNQDFKRAMSVPVCPYVFVLDGNGEVIFQKSGYTPGEELMVYDVVKKAAAAQVGK